jgi:uncharacterized membrane protein YphA (DoxX/SURF4 family)
MTAGAAGVALLLARLVVGGAFVWLALVKLADPVAFLKAIREYGLLADDSRLLNFTAAVLPWVELFCGGLLVLGVAVRGNALVLAALLAVFTAAIAARGVEMHAAAGGSFCALAFDCGCGTGVENVCRKLAENAVLFVLALLAVLSRPRRFCLRGELVRSSGAGAGAHEDV